MSDTPFPPADACDCHLHVIGPKAAFPLVSPRAYTPVDAPLEALEAMTARLGLGLGRVVLVQTSIFGTDNSCMLDGLARLGDRARGVAVVDEATDAAELDRLHRAGVRGLRVNLKSLEGGGAAEAMRQLEAAARLCARNGWHVQTFTDAPTIAALGADLGRLAVPVVIDHFGLLSPVGATAEAEAMLLRLLESGRVWVKLSGVYRLSPPDREAEIAGLARRLCAANPERMLWGSDWPHTPAHQGRAEEDDAELPYRDIDTAALLDLVRRWFDEPRRRQQILVDNPAQLYGF